MAEDEHRCGVDDPDSEYECTHSCSRPKDHSGNHMVIFEWPKEEKRHWK